MLSEELITRLRSNFKKGGNRRTLLDSYVEEPTPENARALKKELTRDYSATRELHGWDQFTKLLEKAVAAL